jgi:hypothetical protein
MPRIRHCVQCPKCLTQYLIPCSPYRNGSYLIPTVEGSSEEYALYCSCGRATVATLLTWSEVKTCDVSNAAYDRGYGTPEEIVPIRNQPQDAVSLDVSRHLNNGKSMERRRNPR